MSGLFKDAARSGTAIRRKRVVLPAVGAVALSMAWKGGMCAAVFPAAAIGVAVVVLVRVAFLPRSSRASGKGLNAELPSEFDNEEPEVEPEGCGPTVGVTRLVSTECCRIDVADAAMERFDDVVRTSYDCRFFEKGIAGVRTDGASWCRGEFPRSHARLVTVLAQRCSDAVRRGEADGSHEPVDSLVLARALVATNLNIDAAAKLVINYCSWRRCQTFGAVVPSAKWISRCPAFCPCEDKCGRPILVIRAREHFPGDSKDFQRGLRATLDAVVAHLATQRSGEVSESNPLEQYLLVIDLEGAKNKNLDMAALKLTLHEAAVHYPERVGGVLVLHAGFTFRGIWSMISKLMHPRTKRKIQLVASAQVAATMRALVPEESLPPKYGGTGTDWKRPSDAVTFDEKVGSLVADVWRKEGIIAAGASVSVLSSSSSLIKFRANCFAGISDVIRRAFPTGICGSR